MNRINPKDVTDSFPTTADKLDRTIKQEYAFFSGKHEQECNVKSTFDVVPCIFVKIAKDYLFVIIFLHFVKKRIHFFYSVVK